MAKVLSSYPGEVPAILLVGGLGTRLRSVVGALPKPLASVGQGAFLELLVQQLRGYGIRRLVMCTGYLAEQIENTFGDGRAWDVEIQYSREQVALGTGGAIKLAADHLRGADDFLVMNGDSFAEVDLAKLIQFHRERGGLITMATREVENASRYGTVVVDAAGRVVGFKEKSGNDIPGIVNAGVYVFKRAALERIQEGRCSLETEVFPQLLDSGLYALQQHGMFIDIGTPEDYARAQLLSQRLVEAACVRDKPRLCQDETS
jgi:D-glycero-alpha-D-manno-heptose 1-phosphate guanylyltransferase